MGVRLLATVLYTHPNLTALARHLFSRLGLAPLESDEFSAAPQPLAAAGTDAALAQLSDEDLAKMGEDLLS